MTEVLHIAAATPDPDLIDRAAAVLRRGGLVAFPTETVYGLGAHALDADACARIFAAKGRPATNPIIVHVASVAEVEQVVAAWPDLADRLAARFWPGPLTLVLPRGPQVPDVVTAGGPTVAVRVPAHPVALALLRAAGLPIAAPSANLSSQLSPTRAAHVLAGLQGKIDLLLDGGPAYGGLESTVLDLSRTPPVLLRPGLLTPADLEAVIGPLARLGPAAFQPEQVQPSPGLLARHYAPRTPLLVVAGSGWAEVEQLTSAGHRVGLVTFGPSDPARTGAAVTVALPPEPANYAGQLYAVLHDLDGAGLDRLVVALPPDTEPWLAVRDRLRRAAVSAASN